MGADGQLSGREMVLDVGAPEMAPLCRWGKTSGTRSGHVAAPAAPLLPRPGNANHNACCPTADDESRGRRS